jgi:hypothetical protein
MSRHLNQIFMALMLCAVLASPAAAQPTNPSGPLWTESSNAKTPADIARLNDHMNNLAEKLKPALVLRTDTGEVVWGRAEWPRRQWDLLREGQEIWYRLDPGTHAFVAADAKGFRGEWVVRGGPVTLAVRRETFPRARAPQG